ncbi:MAG TPA: hypothetical protein PKV16_08055 [Caldisericia bacterium]|nr:hypothetical protein [Caldisericia bacterium]HPF49727.1 hypothetical protein [Caldisericia bacterium]HPI84289.1 hypothetical protein [Caldisericia bacterium]HPQ93716.1 hypothetical protein [Caldisericia bacterium]HRV74860.1 hypothetical protein [Caldisericia bacterium]
MRPRVLCLSFLAVAVFLVSCDNSMNRIIENTNKTRENRGGYVLVARNSQEKADSVSADFSNTTGVHRKKKTVPVKNPVLELIDSTDSTCCPNNSLSYSIIHTNPYQIMADELQRAATLESAIAEIENEQPDAPSKLRASVDGKPMIWGMYYVPFSISQYSSGFQINMINDYNLPIRVTRNKDTETVFDFSLYEDFVIPAKGYHKFYVSYKRTEANAHQIKFFDVLSVLDYEFVTDYKERIEYDFSKSCKIDVMTYPIDNSPPGPFETKTVWKTKTQARDFQIKIFGNIVCVEAHYGYYGSSWLDFIELVDIRDGKMIREFNYYREPVWFDNQRNTDNYFVANDMLYLQCRKPMPMGESSMDLTKEKREILETRCFDINTCEEIPITENEFTLAESAYYSLSDDRKIDINKEIIEYVDEKYGSRKEKKKTTVKCSSPDKSNVFWEKTIYEGQTDGQTYIISQDIEHLFLLHKGEDLSYKMENTILKMSMADGKVLGKYEIEIEEVPMEGPHSAFAYIVRHRPCGLVIFYGKCLHGNESSHASFNRFEIIDKDTFESVFQWQFDDFIIGGDIHDVPDRLDNVLFYDNLMICGKGDIHCFDMEKRELLWKTAVYESYNPNFMVYDDKYLFVKGGETIFALDIDSGKVLWFNQLQNISQRREKPEGECVIWKDMWLDTKTGRVLGKIADSKTTWSNYPLVVRVNSDYLLYVQRDTSVYPGGAYLVMERFE